MDLRGRSSRKPVFTVGQVVAFGLVVCALYGTGAYQVSDLQEDRSTQA